MNGAREKNTCGLRKAGSEAKREGRRHAWGHGHTARALKGMPLVLALALTFVVI